jgi:hypothetical protein
VQGFLNGHLSNTSNPHNVTQTQVGLGNVNNTSDANKPVSTAQQTALNLKANLASPTFSGVIRHTGTAVNFEGTAAKTIAVEANTIANTAGSNLTINAGNATTSSTDKRGGNLVLQGGVNTGGVLGGDVQFWTAPATAGGILTVTINTGGSNYSIGNTLTLVGAGGSGAVLTISNTYYNGVSAVTINAAGSNYTTGTYTTTTNGAGTGAIVTITVTATTTGTLANSGNISNGGDAEFNKKVKTPTLEIKNGAGAAIWTVELNGNDLIFKNAAGVNKAKIDQSGNLTSTGDIIAFGSI